MKIGNLEVCKSTVGQWDNLWNYNVLCDGKLVDMFHTKKEAVEFAKVKFIKDQDTFYGIQNLAEEEALRRHQDAPSHLKGGVL
tara:strand:- start:87 stop:335 length:249 start_codon:yes stop_codon:yes gene_type:complete